MWPRDMFGLMTADRKKLADKLNEEGNSEARKIKSTADREAALRAAGFPAVRGKHPACDKAMEVEIEIRGEDAEGHELVHLWHGVPEPGPDGRAHLPDEDLRR